jgi:hypothetical protein
MGISDFDPIAAGAGPIFLALQNYLFDHLVGAQENRLRHCKAERLGGLDVHDHLEQAVLAQ